MKTVTAESYWQEFFNYKNSIPPDKLTAAISNIILYTNIVAKQR